MDYLRQIAYNVNKINDWIGRTVSLLILPMIFILAYEVVMRYVFNKPTTWVHEIAGMLYAIYFLLGGVYTLRWDAHVNIEILYGRFSPRTKAIVDSFTWLFFYLFCFVILLKGIPFAWESVSFLERANTPFEGPVWLVKIFIPLSALLLLLQGLVKTIEKGILAITGVEISLSNPEIVTSKVEGH